MTDPLLRLFIRRPDLVPDVLSRLGVKLPRYTVVRSATDRHAADVVLQRRWSAVLGIVVEVPRTIHEEHRQRWLQRLVQLTSQEYCPVELLLLTPDPQVAQWADAPLPLRGRRLRPRVQLIPAITCPQQAHKDHAMALLSAIAHATDADEGLALGIAQVARTAILQSVKRADAGWYLGLISESFPERLRGRLIAPIVCPYRDDFSRQHFTLGVAKALHKRLIREFGKLPPGVTEHVLGASLEELSVLRHRLATALSLEEALGVSVASLAHKSGTAAHLLEALALAQRKPQGLLGWAGRR